MPNPASIRPVAVRFASVVLVSALLAAPAAFASPSGGALTPSMGWSSWSAMRGRVSEADIQAQAAKMNSSSLAAAGYEFINIDDGWYMDGTKTVDSYGRWQVNASKFPGGMAALANYVHGLGLKFGLYLTPGIPVAAYDQNTPIEGTTFHARDIVSDTTHFEKSYTWRTSMYFIDYAKNPQAAQAYVDSWARQLGSWGVDYLKFDGVGTSDSMDVIAWRKGLDKTGRTIHLGLSNALDVNNGNLWRQNANSWRIEYDIECGNPCTTLTDWAHISNRFKDLPKWAKFAGPGGWNDPDSIEIGAGSGLTAEESRTQLTLWAAGAAPLLIGADLTALSTDDIGMLTNSEVIAIDQAGNPASPISQATQQQVWRAYNNDGTYTVALFNLGTASADVTVNWSDLGFSGTARVHDAWRKSDVGNFTSSFSANLPSHGSGLFKVTPPAGSSVTTTLVSGATSLCLDKPDPNATSQAMDVSACSGGTNQILSYSGTDKTLRVNGMCLDARNQGTTANTVVQTFQCNGQATQRWNFNGNFTITNAQSSLCLDVKGGLTTSGNGTPVILFGCNGGLNQKWYRR